MISLTIFDAVRSAAAVPIRAVTAIQARSHGTGFELLPSGDRPVEAVRPYFKRY